jgi:hypothetical protein
LELKIFDLCVARRVKKLRAVVVVWKVRRRVHR